MYRLRLCLRYLRSKALAYFAMLGVALCVAMMLIVISVMNGFLDKIERAAKGLFGDIVVESTSLSGLGMYDPFIDEARKNVPEIESASPFIITYGMLIVPGYDLRQPVQIAGIRLPQRTFVSDFAQGLGFQVTADAGTRNLTASFLDRYGWDASKQTMDNHLPAAELPAVRACIEQYRGISFDPPISILRKTVEQDRRNIEDMMHALAPRGTQILTLPPLVMDQVVRMRTAIRFHEDALETLETAEPYQAELRTLGDKVFAASTLPATQPAGMDKLEQRLDDLVAKASYQPPDHRVILGLGIPGLSFRTPQGETVRYLVPGCKTDLWLIPLGRTMSATETPSKSRFTVVDDSSTDVASIDSNIVYIPFDTLQQLNNMGAEYSADSPGELVTPARCSAIHIRVRPPYSDERNLRVVAGKLQKLWDDFLRRHPRATSSQVDVMTWRQRQEKVIAPIESQRTLVVVMFGIISIVSVVLIFVIFYMIVVQKTKDIGVLKAVGASNFGVAQIFLMYGAAVGLTGSILGLVIGTVFVHYINPIHDWLGSALGFQVWSRETFMFSMIPNKVDWTSSALIVAGAILAGLLGAIIPAVRASRMQPVEALRYE
jgi:lipoprotein-releasing system permease protein